MNLVRFGLLSSFCSCAQISTSGISIFINSSESNRVICSAMCSDLKSSSVELLALSDKVLIMFKCLQNKQKITKKVPIEVLLSYPTVTCLLACLSKNFTLKALAKLSSPHDIRCCTKLVSLCIRASSRSKLLKYITC